MDILEQIRKVRRTTVYPDYYIKEITISQRERPGTERDLWLGKYGSETKVFLGGSRSRIDIEAAIRKMEALNPRPSGYTRRALTAGHSVN